MLALLQCDATCNGAWNPLWLKSTKASAGRGKKRKGMARGTVSGFSCMQSPVMIDKSSWKARGLCAERYLANAVPNGYGVGLLLFGHLRHCLLSRRHHGSLLGLEAFMLSCGRLHTAGDMGSVSMTPPDDITDNGTIPRESGELAKSRRASISRASRKEDQCGHTTKLNFKTVKETLSKADPNKAPLLALTSSQASRCQPELIIRGLCKQN